MLSSDHGNRIDLDTILMIPYFQQSIQLKLYFILADHLENMETK